MVGGSLQECGGDFRDSVLREMAWKQDQFQLEMEQSLVEPNM